MSELQAALERWEGWELGDPFDAGTLDVIVDAARLVANPNIEAMARELEHMGILGARRQLIAQRMFAAALTPGDTDD